MPNSYVIALYARLSKSDPGWTDAERGSESIQNQLELLRTYSAQLPERAKGVVKEFVDDGYSGTSFCRPAFSKLKQLIYKREINCVIVKDCSRFGRNYIELGDYLENILPHFGVRFIAINEGYDSAKAEDCLPDLSTSFMNIVYSYYSKNLARQARQSIDQRKKQGIFTSGPVLFGYRKRKGSKYELEIDEPAARIIRRIFLLAVKGNGCRPIAVELNRDQRSTPASSRDRRNFENPWTGSLVARILREERYAGRTANSGQAIGYPALIPPQIYQEAQRVMRPKIPNQGTRRETAIYSRKLRCACCGRCLSASGKKIRYYKCRTLAVTKQFGCKAFQLSETTLTDQILQFIRFFGALRNLKITSAPSREAIRKFVYYCIQEIQVYDSGRWEIQCAFTFLPGLTPSNSTV